MGTTALNVPKEVSPLDVALKKLQGNVPLVSQPCLACPIFCGMAALVQMKGFLHCGQILKIGLSKDVSHIRH